MTLVARGDFAPPEYHARDDWFAGAEAFLRSAVGNTQNYDRTLTALGELAEPSSGWPDSAGAKAVAVPGGVAVVGTAAATTTFAELRMASHSLLFANSSFWWTGGNAHNPPQALLATGLPAATLMSAMLTGRWPDASHVASQGE